MQPRWWRMGRCTRGVMADSASSGTATKSNKHGRRGWTTRCLVDRRCKRRAGAITPVCSQQTAECGPAARIAADNWLKRAFMAVMAEWHTCIHIYIWEYKYIYIGSFAAMLKLMWDHEPCEYCGLYPGREQLRITPGTFTVHCPVCSRMMSNFLDHHNRDRTAWEFFGGLRPWNFPAD